MWRLERFFEVDAERWARLGGRGTPSRRRGRCRHQRGVGLPTVEVVDGVPFLALSARVLHPACLGAMFLPDPRLCPRPPPLTAKPALL